MMRPSHAISFLAGIFACMAHADRSAALFWGAVGIGIIAAWSAYWEGSR